MPLVRHKIKRYGWLPDTPDQRDHLYAAPIAHLTKLPPKVDLRPQCPKVIYMIRASSGTARNGAVLDPIRTGSVCSYLGCGPTDGTQMHRLGMFVTTLFLNLGAPFWFNAMRNMSNLRPVLAGKVEKDKESR